MKLLIDYSVIMHLSWNQMFSDNYEATEVTELDEYTLNLSRNLFYLKNLFKADHTILCLDAPSNWRSFYVRDYYDSRLNLWREVEPEDKNLTYYYFVDDLIWRFRYISSINQWQRAKVSTKKDRDAVMFMELEEISGDVIKTLDVWESAMQYVVPYYKGQRKLSSFKGNTSKEDWKRMSWDHASKIASVVGMDCIVIDYCEGDDIIAGAVMEYNKIDPNEEIVVVSVDQDLYHLKLLHNNVTYYNPRNHEIISISPDEVRYKLLAKIAGGDGSDNISGVMIDGKVLKEVSWTKEGSIRNGKTTVNLIDRFIDSNATGTDITSPAYSYLSSNSQDNTYEKNITLVYLKNIPEELQEQISDRVKVSEVVQDLGYTYDDLFFDKKKRIETINRANEEREELGL